MARDKPLADVSLTPRSQSDRAPETTTAAHSSLAAIYEEIPAMAVVLDERGIILALSRECASQFSSHATRLIGRSILSLAHRDDRAAVAQALRRAVRERDGSAHCEFRIWRGPKPTLELHASLRAANRGDGPTLLHAVCSDITDRNALEQALEQRSKDLSELASELLVAQDRERRRIAADMHDTVGHNLALAQFGLDGLAHANLDPASRNTIAQVKSLIQQTIDAVRSLTFALDSSLLQDRGLDAAVEEFGHTLSAGNSLQFMLSSRPRTRRLSEPARIALYRAIRELLVNTVKHAQARNVRVSIGDDATHLNILVVDDGIGIAADAPDKANGSGLRNLQRQIAALEGTFVIRQRQRGGSEFVISVPYARVRAAAQ